MKHFLIFILSLVLISSCKKKTKTEDSNDTFTCDSIASVSKGDRTIGIDLLDITGTNSFDDNIALAKDLGAEFIALHLNWTGIETSPNKYSDPGNALSLLSQYAKNNNLKFSLTIRPIDLTGKTVPDDLDSTRFGDTQMINRFKKVVDFIFTKVDASNLLNFQIGNEIDHYDYTKEHADFWTDYTTFINAQKDYIHSKNSTVKVGFTGTLYGMMQNKTRFNLLAKDLDLIGVTYYPIKSNFDVKAPSAITSEINDFVKAFDSKPIYFQEIGYQTSATNKSSEALQAEFYCTFFKAWDTHKAKIKSVNILRLNDLSEAKAKISAGPYGLSNPEFIEYLRTLGIRTESGKGENKQAFAVIKKNLADRNW